MVKIKVTRVRGTDSFEIEVAEITPEKAIRAMDTVLTAMEAHKTRVLSIGSAK